MTLLEIFDSPSGFDSGLGFGLIQADQAVTALGVERNQFPSLPQP